MSNREKIRRLEQAGVDETTIVNTLRAALHPERPYAEVRSKLKSPAAELSSGARSEIYYETSYEHTPAELQRMYRISATEAYKAKHVPRKRKDRPEASVVIEAYKRLGTLAETLQELDTSKRHVTAVLSQAGLLSSRSAPDEAEILRLVTAGLTYQEIAESSGLSASTVGRLARAAGMTRQKQRKNMAAQEWEEILQYAEDTTVAEAARKYNVERSNIYYHRKKKDDI